MDLQRLEELLRVPSVSEFDLSSEEFLVYTTNLSGRWQLHLYDKQNHLQLTFDERAKESPKFLSSQKIVYACDFSGDENFDLFMFDLKTRKEFNLTPDTPFSILPDCSISETGFVAFVSNEHGNFSSYVLNTKTLERKRVTYHKYSDSHAEISPDGKALAVSSLVEAQSEGVFVYSLEKDEQITLLDPLTSLPLEATAQCWSSDSKALLFTSSSNGWEDVGLWKLDSNEIIWVTHGGAECYEAVFSSDSRKIAYTENKEGDMALVIYDTTTQEKLHVTPGHGVVESPIFSKDGKRIYFVYSGAKNPPDIWSYDLNEQRFYQVTKSLPENLTQEFVEARHVYYPSKVDGTMIPALLYEPKVNKRIAVIDIHGGPSAQALNTWNPFVQYLVSNGFVVLRPNYRGSTGYGRLYREANRFVMGSHDLLDVVSGKHYLVSAHLVDPKKVGVMGASFGGYLTMCALTNYPEEWAFGVSIVPFLNWFTEIQNEREDLRYWDLENMGDPEKDKDRLYRASPIFFLEKISAPVLLIAGANDPRCPAEEALQAKSKLESLGKRFEFKLYEDEGHGFLKLENKIDAYKRIARFISVHTQNTFD